MATLKLEVNSKINIIWNKEPYKSVIQDINEENILIDIPVYQGSYLTLREGEEIDLSYLKNDNHCYGFSCTVLGRKIENNIPVYILSNPFNVKKIQRRNFVRVPTIEYILYNNRSKDTVWKKALIKDISGGGLKMQIDEFVELKDKLLINIYNEDEKLQVKGEIVRITEDKENKNYICGINFVDIDERMRDRIITKVFYLIRRQREVM